MVLVVLSLDLGTPFRSVGFSDRKQEVEPQEGRMLGTQGGV